MVGELSFDVQNVHVLLVVIELFVRKWNKKKKERKKEGKMNKIEIFMSVFFFQLLYELGQLLWYFLQQNNKSFLSIDSLRR